MGACKRSWTKGCVPLGSYYTTSRREVVASTTTSSSSCSSAPETPSSPRQDLQELDVHHQAHHHHPTNDRTEYDSSRNYYCSCTTVGGRACDHIDEHALLQEYLISRRVMRSKETGPRAGVILKHETLSAATSAAAVRTFFLPPLSSLCQQRAVGAYIIQRPRFGLLFWWGQKSSGTTAIMTPPLFSVVATLLCWDLAWDAGLSVRRRQLVECMLHCII